MTTFTHTSGQYLQIDDAQLYYEVVGNPAGKPLVLLHGGLGNLTDFNSIIGGLPEQFHIIGIDFRGHGRSTLGSSPLTYQLHQSDVERILEHLGIETCALIGCSDGGIVGYRMASLVPTKIETLVTIGAQWKLDASGPVYDMLSGLTAEAWIEMFPGSVQYYKSISPEPNFDALVEAVVALWTDQTPTGYPGTNISKITAPTLIVRGDEDHLLSFSEASEICELIEGANMLNILCAGHEAYKDAPDQFLTAVNRFLLNPNKKLIEM
ncbi:alpha/beta fold hydrolase [Aeromonas dhakensis]|uniref:alpha/beta fold hydrolase n=1 Tax=Aeromonas dhakensis TaxID=196024 RepID=UPI00227B051A|nr:alpha/beta fold hydrolase [Aeromonas dhakensis]WAG00096.1 alpha/beta hydrolase [Aeromonas dhakensis]